jgi:hypothetical protein
MGGHTAPFAQPNKTNINIFVKNENNWRENEKEDYTELAQGLIVASSNADTTPL